MKNVTILHGILWAAALSGCVDGGGTDVGNALVMGTVKDAGMPAAGAEVILMPAGYNPVLGDPARVRATTTDADGGFRFEAMGTGAFAIEVLHPLGARMDWKAPAAVAAGETLMVDLDLTPARTLSVRLPADAAQDAYVFLPGSDVHARREGPEETLRLPHAPAESLHSIGVGRMSAPADVDLYEVRVGPDDTALDLRQAPKVP